MEAWKGRLHRVSESCVGIHQLGQQLTAIEALIRLNKALGRYNIWHSAHVLGVAREYLNHIRQVVHILCQDQSLDLADQIGRALVNRCNGDAHFLTHSLVELGNHGLLQQLAGLAATVVPQNDFGVFTGVNSRQIVVLALGTRGSSGTSSCSVIFGAAAASQAQCSSTHCTRSSHLQKIAARNLFHSILLFFVIMCDSLLIR